MQAGDKVVCVDANHQTWPFDGKLREGAVYVIRDASRLRDGFGVWVIGIRGLILSDGIEAGFHHWRFRKLEELKAQARKRQEVPA